MKNVHENHFCRNKLGPSSLSTLQNDFLRNAKPKYKTITYIEFYAYNLTLCNKL